MFYSIDIRISEYRISFISRKFKHVSRVVLAVKAMIEALEAVNRKK